MVFLEKKADPLFALQVSYQADQLKTFYICRCRRPRLPTNGSARYQSKLPRFAVQEPEPPKCVHHAW
jgi:hypothetical protein